MEELNSFIYKKIKELDDSFAYSLLQEHFERNPEMKLKYGRHHILHYLEDTKFHLDYLAESVNSGEQALFNEYLGWAKTFFAAIPSVSDEDIIFNLELMRDKLVAIMPDETKVTISGYINSGIDFYRHINASVPSFINPSNSLNELAGKYLNFLLNANRSDALELILNAVKSGISIKELYVNVFQVVQRETGRLWQMSRITVAQEHFITSASQFIISQLYPYIFSSKAKSKKIVICCIEGELHEFGARMIADIFELEGWDSYYYGANTPQSSVLSTLRQIKPQILGISVTMTFNLSAVIRLIEQIRADSSLSNIKIIIGGLPFIIAENLWKKLGADGFTTDATHAVGYADELLKYGYQNV